jgi:hypothetical protein
MVECILALAFYTQNNLEMYKWANHARGENLPMLGSQNRLLLYGCSNWALGTFKGCCLFSLLK